MAAKKLTTLGVDRMRGDPARRVEIADALTPGLYLVVQPSGRKSWAVRARVDGRPAKLTLGPYPALGLDQARDRARELLRAVQTGRDPRAEERRVRQASKRARAETVRAVCELWLAKDQAGHRSVEEVRRLMTREVLPQLGDLPIREVRKSDIIALVEGIAERGAPIAANRALAWTRRLFRWAAGRDLVDIDPTQFVAKPAREVRRDRVLDDEELKEVWRAAGTVGGAFGAGVRLLILTGARRDEIFGARRSELTADGHGLRLPAGRSKNGEARVIWLAEPARRLLADLPHHAGADWLLTATGRAPYTNYGHAKAVLDAAIAAARARAAGPSTAEQLGGHAMPAWRLHDLRRTVATGLQRLGIRLEVIEAVLGHVSGSRTGVVGVYQRHRFEAEARDALGRWGAHVERLMGLEAGEGQIGPTMLLVR